MDNCGWLHLHNKNQPGMSKREGSKLCNGLYARFSRILIISKLVKVQRYRGKEMNK